MSGVVSGWSSRTSAFAGCSLYAVTDNGLVSEAQPTTDFGGSDQIVAFNELYNDATVTIWPPESGGYIMRELTAAAPLRLSDGTQLRSVQIDSSEQGAPVGEGHTIARRLSMFITEG